MTSRRLSESAQTTGTTVVIERYLNRRDCHELMAKEFEIVVKNFPFRGELAG